MALSCTQVSALKNPDRPRKERVYCWIAVLLFALPVTADRLIYSGCGGICAVDPIAGATPAPFIPGLNDAIWEAQSWRDEIMWIVNQDLSPNGQTLAIIVGERSYGHTGNVLGTGESVGVHRQKPGIECSHSSRNSESTSGTVERVT